MKATASRRRTKAQIEEEKLDAAKKERDIQAKLAHWDEMEQALEESETQRLTSIQKLSSF
jgi:hypothetical protein